MVAEHNFAPGNAGLIFYRYRHPALWFGPIVVTTSIRASILAAGGAETNVWHMTLYSWLFYSPFRSHGPTIAVVLLVILVA
jgi:hypothetical protein